MLTASPRSDGRRYVCHSRHGCGKLTINADMVEKYVFDVVLPVADSSVMRNVLRSENEDVAKKAAGTGPGQLSGPGHAELSLRDDSLPTRYVTRQAFLRQSQRLSERIEDQGRTVSHPARTQRPGQARRRRPGQLGLDVGR